MPRATIGNLPVMKQDKEYAPVLTENAYKHSIVTADREPLGALLTHIEGTSWTVDYYSQVLGSDEEPSPPDAAQSGSYQQYLYIHHYELKLQGPLNSVTDVSDQTQSVTGSAIMYPYMKPNYGDAFIADVGDGNAGLFTITEVEKKSYFKQACYEIQFTLSKYLTKELEDNLNAKVIKQTEFVKDFMTYGQNPVVATSERLKHATLENLVDDSLNDWLGEYYSNEYRTILVPNQSVVTYDPFVTRMITTVFPKDKYPLIKHIDLLNVDDNNLNYYTDIWSTLLKRETYMLRNCFSRYYSVNSKTLNGNVFLQTAYYSGIHRIIVPVPGDNLADERLGLSRTASGETLSGMSPAEEGFTISDMTQTHEYVFSQSVYSNARNQASTDLENMVLDYMDEKRLDWEKLKNALEDRHNWCHLQRFYAVPVLLLLAISEMRRT